MTTITSNATTNNTNAALYLMSEPITKGLNLNKIYIKLWYVRTVFCTITEYLNMIYAQKENIQQLSNLNASSLDNNDSTILSEAQNKLLQINRKFKSYK